MNIFFWILLIIIIYSYLGYTLVLLLINIFIRNKSIIEESNEDRKLPEISLVIAAYNESDFIDSKMENISSLDYPDNKLRIIWVTDGSTDDSEKKLSKYPGIEVYHKPAREGKSQAINRVMPLVGTPITVFTDTNSIMNKSSLRELVLFFNDPLTACVSGEKRIHSSIAGSAVSAGEGTYWKYESLIKKLESRISSAVSSAGEIFALRTELFETIDRGVINDDLAISLSVIKKGYNLKYSHLAFASEKGSLNIHEEIKRKVRIAAGGIQSLILNPDILNPFKYGFYSFQFFSHKVLRWTLVPLALPLIFLVNLYLVLNSQGGPDIYTISFILQAIFYLFVIIGAVFRNSKLSFKIFFLPYYLIIMNISIIKGIVRYMRGKITASWEKSERMI